MIGDTPGWLAPEELDIAADTFDRGYRLYQASLNALLGQMLEHPDAASGKVRTRLDNDSHELMMNWWVAAAPHLGTLTRVASAAGVAGSGRALSGPSATLLSDLVAEAQSELYQELYAVALRDRETMRRGWRRFALEVVLSTHRYGKNAALFLAPGRVGRLQYRYPDRGGKLWDSGTLVRTMIRGHLVTTQVESLLFALVKNGRDLAKVTWGDDRDPLIISISGKSDTHPSYLEAREQLFHPNSTAIVGVV